MKPQTETLRLGAILLAAIAGLAVTAVVYQFMTANETEAQFDIDAAGRISAIKSEIDTDFEVVHSVLAFYRGSDFVREDEFKVFTSSALHRRDSIQALQWAPLVPKNGRETFPVTYVEPVENNEKFRRDDLGSHGASREALVRARDTREVVMSGPVRLEYGKGILVIGAAYKKDQLEGFVVAVLGMDDLVKAALDPFPAAAIDIVVRDKVAGPLYGAPPTDRKAPFEQSDDSSIGGRELSIRCTPAEGYVPTGGTGAPLAMAAALLLVTIVLVGYLVLVTSRTRRIENLVAERTAEIAEVTRLQRAILDGATYAIVSTDPNGIIQTFNVAATRMLGHAASDVIGKKTPALFHKKSELLARAKELTEELGRPIHPGFEVFVAKPDAGLEDDREWTFVRKDGTELPVRLSITSLRDEGGRTTGYLGVANDITLRLRHERGLEAAIAAAESANRTKSRFLANMSHELRTPLNAIIGYSEMLEEDAAKAGMEQSRADLQKIKMAGRHLLQVINDMLDLSKIEAGRMELELEPTDLAEVVEDVAATIRPLISERGNTLVLSIAEDLGMIRADVTRLRQVLYNLLSNAAKFTEKGTIRLEATADHDQIEFSVGDTGIGMTQRQLDHVFDPFSQADSSTTRKYGGTGLGLTICKEFCELMGGTITVLSAAGQGSTFTVRLPLATTPPLPVPDATKDTVLVIDDDATVAELMTRLLDREGFRVITAADGPTGMDLARKERPVAIILDVVMPSMDGWAVLSRLKADPELAPIPVIMQTMVDRQSIGYALGAAEYLVKPIDRDRLVLLLRRFRSASGAGSVIVVEDEPDTREMICRSLRKAGWTVREATNGREAIAQVRGDKPAVILLDLLMPEMDGFEVVEEVRRNPDWKSIAIVILTAKDLTDEDRERLSGSVQRILQKGAFKRDDLLAEVSRLVKESVYGRARSQ
ncbi:MAG: response regulator [Planctomycetota bacterium]|nr:response regulator [Planctomycetota bacterium]